MACPAGTYQASSGDCVEDPDSSSSNATAICRDGTDSHSESHSGTCSHHGGVAQWCPCGGSSSAPVNNFTTPTQDDNEFVALAISPITGQPGGWGTAGSQDQANQIAVAECSTAMGNTCEVVAWAHNGCTSVAFDSNSGLFAGAAGPDITSAETNALEKLNSPGARVTAFRCSS